MSDTTPHSPVPQRIEDHADYVGDGGSNPSRAALTKTGGIRFVLDDPRKDRRTYRRFGITWGEPLGLPECPYVIRWIVPLGPFGSLRVHHWLSSDDKRAKHDHPQDFMTLVLAGSYVDWSSDVHGNETRELMSRGTLRYRKAEHRHTVLVEHGECWTLLWFKPKRREWGFYVRKAGRERWFRFNRYFATFGHHPCE